MNEKRIEFRTLKVGQHFRFANKLHGTGVGIKTMKSIYRLRGLNRVIGSLRVSVVPTTDPLN
jgi:hypothetical protein